jgi:hypothetical protein
VFDWCEETRAAIEACEAALRGDVECVDDDDHEEGGCGDCLEDVEAELAAIAAESLFACSQGDKTTVFSADVRSRLTSHACVVERRSIFQAHVCRGVKSVDEVAMVMDVLCESRKVREATHNILAYRIERDDGKGIHQDHDDDGESAAGGRLLRLLQLADARNVIVVVSRWYGGVKLGPSRFHVINSTAQQALEELGEIHRDKRVAS